MLEYQSDYFSIEYREKERLILPSWTDKELNAELFMDEMKRFMDVVYKTKPLNAVWSQQNFTYQIPSKLFNWIEDEVNKPGKKVGVKKVGFVLGEDVLAQFSTMETFEATNSVFAPRYFSDAKKALEWVDQKEEIIENPFEKEINLLIEKNLEKGSAKIQIELSLEQLPFYLKKLKELVNHQTFVYQNYQRYMLLTAREREILTLICDGYTSQRISDKLYVALNTILTHRKNILRKLDCKNVAELVKYKVFISL